MTLQVLEERAGTTLVVSLITLGLVALVSGGEAVGLLLIIGVIGSLALQVLLLAIVADATVQTLKKQNKKRKK